MIGWARVAGVGLCLLVTSAWSQTNVLLLLADDIGVDRVGAYGEHPDPGHTPVIDGLAASGILFRNAWSTPVCSPTRACILTGQYPSRTGVGNAMFPDKDKHELWDGEVTLPHLLEPGVATLLVGKWHLGLHQPAVLPGLGSGLMHPLACGFRHWTGNFWVLQQKAIGDGYTNWVEVVDGVPSPSTVYNTTAIVDSALGLIASTPEPWFLEVAFNAPHMPFHKPPPELHTFSLPQEVKFDIPVHVKAAIEAMDTEIGRLLASMDPAVLANTVIIFAGDNGTDKLATTEPFVASHGKGTLYEGGINVPLIVSGKGVAAGAECTSLVSLTDLFATVAELESVPQTTGLDSVSLVPYLTHPLQPSLRQTVFSEWFVPPGFPPYAEHHRAVRDERFKLVRHEKKGVTSEEFFDLDADPFELQDLLQAPLGPKAAIEYGQLSTAIELQPEPFNATGIGMAGQLGEPRLSGAGDLSPGTPLSLEMEAACPLAPALLFLGQAWLGTAFHGGVLGPKVLLAFPPMVTDSDGRLETRGLWPEDVPPGMQIILQFWLHDPASLTGYAASNELVIMTPGP
ncbi:MAG TPA: sulfatase-like hydrolase/transferase [Planctomycetota bacterium]|nr:sulfatase-like hydrolase/transferase [Planctomycetota bacterium]